MIFVIFREFHIPLLLIATIIGYQISLYFFYQYFKNKRFNFDLNKIFLALGLFSLLILTAFIFRIVDNYYIEDPILLHITGKLIVFFVLLGGIVFLLVILDNSFSKIVSSSITKLIILLNLLSSLLLLFIDLESPWISIILIPNSIVLLYIYYIQLKFLYKSMGQIRSRFKKILIGEFLFGIALVFGSEETDLTIFFDEQTIFIISIFVAIIGLFIIFLGVYRFPIFVEFGWTSQLLRLYIIDQKNLRGIYIYDFLKSKNDENREQEKDQVYSKGILGIETIIGYLMGKNIAEIETIEHGNHLIIIKHGGTPLNFLTYALLVKSNMKSFDIFLDLVKSYFEAYYRVLLLQLDTIKGQEESIFSSFDEFILDLIK